MEIPHHVTSLGSHFYRNDFQHYTDKHLYPIPIILRFNRTILLFFPIKIFRTSGSDTASFLHTRQLYHIHFRHQAHLPKKK